MSELSDHLREIMNQIQADSVKEDEEADGPMSIWDSTITNYEYFQDVMSYYSKKAEQALHRVYRRHAGKTPWGSSEAAFGETVEEMKDAFCPLIFQCVADGIQYGQESSPAYRKFRVLKKLDNVLDNLSWRMESDVISLRYSSDPDVVEMVRREVEAITLQFAQGSGYTRNLHNPRKIYDLWFRSFNSATITAHCVGRRIGEQDKEMSTLTGILAATEETE